MQREISHQSLIRAVLFSRHSYDCVLSIKENLKFSCCCRFKVSIPTIFMDPVWICRDSVWRRAVIEQCDRYEKLFQYIVLSIRLVPAQPHSSHWSFVPASCNGTFSCTICKTSKWCCGAIRKEGKKTQRVKQAVCKSILPVFALSKR